MFAFAFAGKSPFLHSGDNPMRMRVAALCIVVVSINCLSAADDDKLDGKYLVGKWAMRLVGGKLTESKANQSVEFKDDMTFLWDNNGFKTEGTYALNGTTLELTKKGEKKVFLFWKNLSIKDGKMIMPIGDKNLKNPTLYTEFTRGDAKSTGTPDKTAKAEDKLDVKDLVGTWSVKLVVTTKKDSKDTRAQTIEFKDDGTYQWTIGPLKMEGSYKLTGTSLELAQKDGKKTTTWANLSMKDGKLLHPIDGSNGKVYEELSKKTDSK
jgi:uncharacterized protein (TIGR03066 family)